MKHALVIGGTGMLSGTVSWLCNNGYRVSVLARGADKYKKMIQGEDLTQKSISFIQVNYYDVKAFQKSIIEAEGQNGPITLCLSWMRGDAEESFQWLISYFIDKNKLVTMYEIRGSHASRTSFHPVQCGNFSWRRIILGFHLDKHVSRWLTNKEISNGVIESIKKEKGIYIVGSVEPWDRRP